MGDIVKKPRFQGRKVKLRTTGLSAYNAIEKYYNNPGQVDLSKSNERIRLRLAAVYHECLKFTPTIEIIALLVAEHGISEIQAYNDLRNSKKLFGDIMKTNKAAEKHFLLEGYKKILTVALKTNDGDMVEKIGKRIESVIGVHFPDDQSIDWTKIKPHKVEFVNSEEELKKIAAEMLLDVEDIDHEEVED